jgi:hypothetical protein
MLRHGPANAAPDTDHAPSWFRSTEGRRYGRHFGALIAIKIVLLALLYYVFIASPRHTDTSPGHVYDAIRGAQASANSNTPNPPQSEATP